MNVKALFIYIHFGLLGACEMSRLSRAVTDVVTIIGGAAGLCVLSQ
jgi:hypothetical protein